jgi:hypothetical protein
MRMFSTVSPGSKLGSATSAASMFLRKAIATGAGAARE